MKTIFPDYEKSLTNLSNSILKYFDVKTFHNTLPELDDILNEEDYKNVVLILYDGMGSNLLKRNLRPDSFFNTHKVKDINAVFPPTTTASTTSVLSGLNPNEHGWLGWDLYFKDVDKTVTMFTNTIKDTEILAASEYLANKYYPYKTIIELINEKYDAYPVVSFGDNPYADLNDMYEKIVDLCHKDGKKFIYAYNHNPDHDMHDFGTDADEIKELFAKLDKETENLCNRLNDTLVIVVSDHGHLNCEYITLSDYEDIFNTLKQDISIEGRACAFFIKDGEEKRFEKLFQKYFRNDFILYRKEDVIKNNLFGIGENNSKFNESLGDYLAVAISNKYFRYNENGVIHKSMHAGITEDEVLVPLIVCKCNN